MELRIAVADRLQQRELGIIRGTSYPPVAAMRKQIIPVFQLRLRTDNTLNNASHKGGDIIEALRLRQAHARLGNLIDGSVRSVYFRFICIKDSLTAFCTLRSELEWFSRVGYNDHLE